LVDDANPAAGIAFVADERSVNAVDFPSRQRDLDNP
jgi:hypothetical protein